MRRLQRVVPRIAFMAALGLAVTSCGGTGGTASSSNSLPFKLVHPGQLTVATSPTYPPWFIIVPGINGGQDTAGGVDGALINAFAKQYGLKVVLDETTFASSILDAQQSKADIVVAISYNPNRAKQLYYTAAFGSEPTVVYTQSSFNYTGPDSLAGKKVATGNGYFEQAVLQQWGKGQVVLFPSNVTGQTALVNGQVDAWFSDASSQRNEPFKSHSITAHALNTGDFGFTAEQILGLEYNGVRCGNGALAKAIDGTLKNLQSSGTWGGVLSQFLTGVELTNVGANPPTQGCSA